MPASSEMKVTRLSGSIGAAITGVDLKSVDSAGIAAIRAAFLEHCMVVFPNQFLGADDQHAFAKKLGEIMIYDGIEQDPNLPDGMMKFTNDGKDKVITENWHFDGMYYPEPPAVGILAAQRLPSAGGDTMWSNQYLAYERLSDGLKQILNGLHCHYESTNSARCLQPFSRRCAGTPRPGVLPCMSATPIPASISSAGRGRKASP